MGSVGVLAQLFPKEGPALPPCPPTGAQEPTGATAITMCQTLAPTTHPATPLVRGPQAKPRLHPVRSGLLSPPAAGEIEERPASSLTAQSSSMPGHPAAGTSNSLPAGGLYPDSSHELPAVVPASPSNGHLAMWHVCQQGHSGDHKSPYCPNSL